jgi:hypothetical protein
VLLYRVARSDTLVRVTPIPTGTRSVGAPRTSVRLVLRAGPFPRVRDAWYGLTVTDAQGDLALTLLSRSGRELARCRYPRGSYPYVSYTQATALACRLHDPAELARVVVTASDEQGGLAVLAAGPTNAPTGGYLLRPQRHVEDQSAAAAAFSRMSAARPAGLGGPTFLLAVGSSVAATLLAAGLALAPGGGTR